MAEPVARRRSPLVDAAAAVQGATPVPQEEPPIETATPTPLPVQPPTYAQPQPEQAPEPEAEPTYRTYDTVHIKGIFDNFDVTYITTVDPENLGFELANTVVALRQFGFTPTRQQQAGGPPAAVPGAPQQPQFQPPPQQNSYGQPPQAPIAYTPGPGEEPWNNNPMPQGAWAPPGQQGYAPPPPQNGFSCGHGPQAVKMGKFGMECSYRSQQPFPNSRMAQTRSGPNAGQVWHYCKAKS